MLSLFQSFWQFSQTNELFSVILLKELLLILSMTATSFLFLNVLLDLTSNSVLCQQCTGKCSVQPIHGKFSNFIPL